MKTLILDGSLPGDKTAEVTNRLLEQKLHVRGWDVENIPLREQKIGNCAGDFFCWVRNPGMCNTNDDNRVIAAKIANSDLLVYLTPITFGGYSSTLKRMVDHQIQNILPFFANVDGEIHHQRRYKKYPDLLVIGWMDSPDGRAEAIFRHLVHRNAINLFAASSVCGVVIGEECEDQLAIKLHTWLEDIAHKASSATPTLPTVEKSVLEAKAIRHALLLVGSPRTRKSTSASIGGYLMEQLEMLAVKTETIQIYTTLNSPARMSQMLASIEAADLVILAFPLYVDSLPAPVIVALERIAEHRVGKHTDQRVAAIANCGFPEATHNATALSICETFAHQAGFVWAGALALGGGQGLVHGTPLTELDGRAVRLKKSLELAAKAVFEGGVIPPTAIDLMAKPVIPRWMYLLAGEYGWKQLAKDYGMAKNLKRQPYEIVGSEK